MREINTEIWQNIQFMIAGIFTEYFGNCEEDDGILLILAENLGSGGVSAMMEIIPEQGFHEADDQIILHFHTTFSERSPEQEEEDIPYSLNAINQLISSSAMPMYGSFGFFEPIRQIYHSYRLAVNGDRMEQSERSLRHFAKTFAKEMGLLADLVQLVLQTPGRLNVNGCLSYLKTLAEDEEKK